MKKTFNTIMLALLILLGVSASAAGGVFEKILADKKFDIDENALLSINHKYGMVTCKNWDQQAIAVKITAEVDAASREAAEKIFARIEYELSGKRSKVSFESRNSDNLFKGKNNKLTIRVEVMMPEAVQLNIRNQFGNCYIGRVSGATEIQIEYGSLEIAALKNEENKVGIDFGNGRIEYIRQGKVEISYSPLNIGESDFLSVESNYSDVKIRKVERLRIDTEGGSVLIELVDDAVVSAKFSDCIIKKLGRTLRAESDYGSLIVSEVLPQFELVEIENAYGSTVLDFGSGASFRFEAEVDLGTIKFPESQFKLSRREVTYTGSRYTGTIGSNPQKALVKIDNSYGRVKIGL